MRHIVIIILFILRSLILIFGKECISSQDDPTSIICSETSYITKNLTYYLSNFTNITQLSLVHSYLTEMPDLHDYNQIVTLHLNNNQIQLINRSYSTIEYLYLTSNHIYALHEINVSFPKLKFLDLSHNPIEYIVDNFFSDKQFPQLQILKLTNALKHINPFIIDNRLISFSSLKYLNEMYMDENDFEEFICSKNATHIQWILPSNIKKISFGKNKLTSFDPMCLSEILNLTELSLRYNYLKNFSNFDFIFPYLSKIQLDYNLFNNVPSNFLYSSQQLTELNLSANHLNLDEIKPRKQYVFPSTLKILYLNSVITDLSCSILENLIDLEQLHLEHLTSTRLKNCIFRKLTKLKTVC
jgi:hypothetical protein